MKIAILKERRAFEFRVAATPNMVKRYVDAGHQVTIEQQAGIESHFSDQAYQTAGAQVVGSYQEALKGAQVVLKVQHPLTKDEGEDEMGHIESDAILIGILSPYQNKSSIQIYAERGISAIAMELLPRITRAQSMDILSSQTNLAGYRAVIEASQIFNRAIPMMMTAAGTIPPARALILGAGVAGLQAIATAKRLGAIVSAFDVRAAAKEQVESLGATFVSVQANSSGDDGRGYAEVMSAEYQNQQAECIRQALKANDIIITTAQIPGKTSPVLITKDMVDGMKPGSVIVDLAIENGGNCAVSKFGEIITHNGVKVVGYPNMPSRIAHDASALYARNLFNFVKLLDKSDDKQPSFDFNDQIIKDVTLTHNGKIIHEKFL